MNENLELIEVVRYPRMSGKSERRILCPECENSRLPLDAVTECDNCSAHIELHANVIAPAINND